ncbi:response regulator [Paenibacillaceae bacterium]|nr:response regulator [Paenibacillaceae bacterium]
MKVMIVDNDHLALRNMENMLKMAEEVEIIGMYTNPLEALETVRRAQPDLVFLDIEMTLMSGLKLAEKLLDFNSNIRVVFATRSKNYAVKAFELRATDYLVKPIYPERLAQSLQRVRALQTVRPAFNSLQ